MKPSYNRSKLAKYIVDQLVSGADEQKLSMAVASYLIDQRKTADLDSLLRDVTELRASSSGIVELTAKSAYPLQDAQKSQIKQVTEKRYPNVNEVIIHEMHDPAVVGGASLSFANASLDLTIKAKLNHLRESIA